MLLVDGFATLFKQVAGWLRTGVWKPSDFWTGISPYLPFDRPHSGWVIPDQLLDHMLDGPRWFWMLVWFALIYGLALLVSEWVGKGVEKAKARWRERKDRPLLTHQGRVTLAVIGGWFFAIPTLVSLVLWRLASLIHRAAA